MLWLKEVEQLGTHFAYYDYEYTHCVEPFLNWETPDPANPPPECGSLPPQTTSPCISCPSAVRTSFSACELVVPSNIDPRTTHLVLSENAIQSISTSDFQGLVNLIDLNLSDNIIEQLGAFVFSEMPKLQHLRLKRNLVDHIDPEAFQGIPDLRSVILASNNISTFPPILLSGVSLLDKLVLSKNELSFLDPQLFQSTHYLKTLLLGQNPLGTLDSNQFKNVPFLIHLSLMKTGLSSLPQDLFEDLINLKHLDLKGNSLQTLSAAHIPSHWRGISLTLEIEKNPLQCCTRLWLKDQETRGSVIWDGSPPDCLDEPWSTLSDATCN